MIESNNENLDEIVNYTYKNFDKKIIMELDKRNKFYATLQFMYDKKIFD